MVIQPTISIPLENTSNLLLKNESKVAEMTLDREGTDTVHSPFSLGSSRWLIKEESQPHYPDRYCHFYVLNFLRLWTNAKHVSVRKTFRVIEN